MRTLCVMAKAPVLGGVKTRLARGIGGAQAVAAYRTMLALALRRLARHRRWRLVLAIAPHAALKSRALAFGGGRIAQGPGDLGRKMQRVYDRLRAHGPVVIIGSDIPAIAPRDIFRAFHALEAHDAVIGPSDDGGYWLIGFGRRRRLAPFTAVRWSSVHALGDTLAGLAGARVATLRALTDIDSAEDWRAWTRQPPSRGFRGD
jgi:hypothetical protein